MYKGELMSRDESNKNMRKIYANLKPFSTINITFYFLCICLVLSSLYFFFQIITTNYKDASGILILVGLSGALITLTYNIRRHLSEDYFKDASTKLEKAYAVLLDTKTGEITRDRFSWGTSARLLLSAENISKHIIMKSHKRIYNEYISYWKVEFRKIIKDFSHAYYASSQGKQSGEADEISVDTIYVIHKFLLWEDDIKDALVKQKIEPKVMQEIKISYPFVYDYISSVKRRFK